MYLLTKSALSHKSVIHSLPKPYDDLMNFWPLLTAPSLWSAAQKLGCHHLTIICHLSLPGYYAKYDHHRNDPNSGSAMFISTTHLYKCQTNTVLTSDNLCGLSLTGMHFHLKRSWSPLSQCYGARRVPHNTAPASQLQQVNAISIRISEARIFMHSSFLLSWAVRSTVECSAVLAQDGDKPKIMHEQCPVTD